MMRVATKSDERGEGPGHDSMMWIAANAADFLLGYVFALHHHPREGSKTEHALARHSNDIFRIRNGLITAVPTHPVS